MCHSQIKNSGAKNWKYCCIVRLQIQLIFVSEWNTFNRVQFCRGFQLVVGINSPDPYEGLCPWTSKHIAIMAHTTVKNTVATPLEDRFYCELASTLLVLGLTLHFIVNVPHVDHKSFVN